MTSLLSKKENSIFIIKTKKEDLYVSNKQLLYDPIQKKWIKAKNLTNQNIFINYQGKQIKCINIGFLEENIRSYEISLEYPHMVGLSP